MHAAMPLPLAPSVGEKRKLFDNDSKLLMTLAEPTLIVAAAIVDLGLSSLIFRAHSPIRLPVSFVGTTRACHVRPSTSCVHLWPHRRLPGVRRWSSWLGESRTVPYGTAACRLEASHETHLGPAVPRPQGRPRRAVAACWPPPSELAAFVMAAQHRQTAGAR